MEFGKGSWNATPKWLPWEAEPNTIPPFWFCERIAEGELKETKEIPKGGKEKEKGAIKRRKA